MDSVDPLNKFVNNCLHTLIIFAPTINLVGKQYSDVRFVENQVIRDEKINLENLSSTSGTRPSHPFFSLYQCETLDSCGLFFRREDLFLRPTSDSVLIPPLLAMLQSFSSWIKPPPEFMLTKFQLYRCLPNFIQWILFLPCFVCSKMLRGCKIAFVQFWKTMWSVWCWIGLGIRTVCCFPCTCLMKICSPKIRAPPPDPEHQTQHQNPSYGAVGRHTTQPDQSPYAEHNRSQQSTIPKKGRNNEEGAPSPPAVSTPSLRNNEPTFSLMNEFESLKKVEPVEAVTVSESANLKEDIDEYEESLKAVTEDNSYERELEKTEEELNKMREEQEKQKESLKHEEPILFDNGNDEFQEMNKQFQMKRDEQDRLHKEELEEMRRKRREKQKENEEELLKMREEFQQRQKALLTCIMMKMRFEEKEEEWGDFLRKIRSYISKVSTSAFDLQDELRRSSGSVEERSENIAMEVKFLAKSVNIAQDVLANAYYFLEEQSEKYDDRIFLKMILKSVLTEGRNCDWIGNNLSELLRSPLNIDIQEKCKTAISKLNAHAIPTTQKLKTDSVSAREEDYLNLGTFPEPDWFSTI